MRVNYRVDSLTSPIPKVYTIGMSTYAVINLKTDPKLKERAAKTAEKLGVSLSAVLNNELRRFADEQSVVFELPEIPNAATQAELSASKKEIDCGDYYHFDSNDEAFSFLADRLG